MKSSNFKVIRIVTIQIFVLICSLANCQNSYNSPDNFRKSFKSVDEKYNSITEDNESYTAAKDTLLIDFSSLLDYHKQEAAEGMSYITTFITIILGIIGYLGAVKKVRLKVRIAIAAVFLLFSVFVYQSINGATKMHNAIHKEIRERVSKRHYFLTPDIECRMKQGVEFKTRDLIAGIIFIDICMVAAIFFFKNEEDSKSSENIPNQEITA